MVTMFHRAILSTSRPSRRECPIGRVEALRELAADCAGHGGAARHADHRAGVAGHVPFAGFLIRGDGGVSLVQLDVFGGDFAGGHREGDVVVEEDLGFLFVSTVLVVVAHAFLERADAGAGHDLVVVALGDVLFGHEVAVGVVPAGLRAVGPSQQAHVPREFEHCAGAEVDGAVRVDAELGLGARTTGAPRAQLTDGNDDDFVFRLGSDVGPIVQVDRSLLVTIGVGSALICCPREESDSPVDFPATEPSVS